MVACPFFGLPSIKIDRTIPDGNPQDIFPAGNTARISCC